MHEQCTANMHKCQCMKFSCIIPVARRGEEMAHFLFCYVFA